MNAKELKALARSDYAAYLQSEHWKTLRRLKVHEAAGRCQLCNKQGKLEVHHRTYDRVGEELLQDLIALCPDCHGKFHGNMGGPVAVTLIGLVAYYDDGNGYILWVLEPYPFSRVIVARSDVSLEEGSRCRRFAQAFAQRKFADNETVALFDYLGRPALLGSDDKGAAVVFSLRGLTPPVDPPPPSRKPFHWDFTRDDPYPEPPWLPGPGERAIRELIDLATAGVPT